jgi:type III restriction enzyme
MQELVFDLSAALTREYLALGHCEAPAHVLFPQVADIVRHFLDKKVVAYPPADKKDIFLAPYWGWAIERLRDAICGDTAQGEAPEVPLYETHRGPGSTAEVDFWTSRDVREVTRSHLNYVVADTKKWEQQAAYYIDRHELVDAFVKNAGLGFAIPYLHNGQMHDYVPDFLIRLKTDPPIHVILETKGYDPLAELKTAAARRWVNAVNADGRYGRWEYKLAERAEVVDARIRECASTI